MREWVDYRMAFDHPSESLGEEILRLTDAGYEPVGGLSWGPTGMIYQGMALYYGWQWRLRLRRFVRWLRFWRRGCST